MVSGREVYEGPPSYHFYGNGRIEIEGTNCTYRRIGDQVHLVSRNQWDMIRCRLLCLQAQFVVFKQRTGEVRNRNGRIQREERKEAKRRKDS